jgi:hypothetical protein
LKQHATAASSSVDGMACMRVLRKTGRQNWQWHSHEKIQPVPLLRRALSCSSHWRFGTPRVNLREMLQDTTPLRSTVARTQRTLLNGAKGQHVCSRRDMTRSSQEKWNATPMLPRVRLPFECGESTFTCAAELLWDVQLGGTRLPTWAF